MRTHYAVRMRAYSGFGRSFGRELDEMTRACSVMVHTTAPITHTVADVNCGACKRTYEYRLAVAQEKNL